MRQKKKDEAMLADRRDLLAGFTAFIGTSLAAPLERALAAGAATADTGPDFTASRTILTADQRAQVAAFSERIMPTTDTPGAIAAGVPAFIEMMLADWYGEGDRAEFFAGLKTFDDFAHAQHAKSFAALSAEQQDAALRSAMGGMMPGLSVTHFEHCRQMVLLGYFTSEIGCRQERVYLPVPGRYDGHYPYAQVKRIFSA
jgi:hypothetical protein